MIVPHPLRWMKDVELLLWMTSSGKRLWLGGGREADGGAWDFTGIGGLGVQMGGMKGNLGEPWLRDVLVQNVGQVTNVPPPVLTMRDRGGIFG